MQDKLEPVVTKSNKLVEATYRLSVNEQRLIAMLSAQVSPKDEDFKPYAFKVAKLVELLDGNSKNHHQRIKDITRGLIGRVVQVREPERLVQTAWLSSAIYHEGKGTVELAFDPNLKPYMLQLKERFTSYKLANVIQLRSRYSVRLYELLKQYESIGSRKFQLEELRRLLGVKTDAYKTWKDFKRRVLDPAAEELPEKTDLRFSYSTERRSRKIAFITFTIGGITNPEKLSTKRISFLTGEATKCWNRCSGNCSAKWSDHQSQADTCHWCRKFETPRAEAAGQLRLAGT